MSRPSWPEVAWTTKVAVVLAPLSLWFYAIEQRDFLHGRLSRGQVFGRDFINYWSGARLLLDGRIHEAYAQAAYTRALARFWGPGIGLQSFSYPPSFLPFIAWAGAPHYGVAFAIWSAGGLALLLAAAWPLSRKPGLALLILLSPAVVVCLDDGQNGLLTAALLVGGLRLADRRPILAGVLVGLASFKPQLGLLIPLALIAAGRWRMIAAAAAAALALGAASVAVVGTGAWRLYFSDTLPFQRLLQEHSTGVFEAMTPSPFIAGRLLGLPLSGAYTLQAIVSLACAILVIAHFWRLRRERRPLAPPDILLLLTAGFLATPYSFNYDMAGLVVVLLLAERSDPRLADLAAWRWSVVCLWAAPIVMVVASVALSSRGLGLPPVGPPLVAIGLILLVTAIAQRRRLAGVHVPAPG